jgi:DNA-directed RNA polymerase
MAMQDPMRAQADEAVVEAAIPFRTRIRDLAGDPEAFEAEMALRGQHRHARRLEGEVGAVLGGFAQLHRIALPALVTILTPKMEAGKKLHAGLKTLRESLLPFGDSFLVEFTAIAAHVTLTVMLHRIKTLSHPVMQGVVERVAQGVEVELQLAALEAVSPSYLQRLEREGLATWGIDRVIDELQHAGGAVDHYDLPRWPRTDACKLALDLITHAIEHCRLDPRTVSSATATEAGNLIFTRETSALEVAVDAVGKVTRSQQSFLRLTAEAMEMVEAGDAEFVAYGHDKLPLPYPPKPWTGMYDGGLHHHSIPFINRRLPRDAYRTHTDDGGATSLKPAFETATALGEVAWQVNPKMLNVLRTVDRETREGVDSIHDDRQRARARERAHRIALVREVAEAYALLDQFFTPHTIDFRGRYYALSSRLNFLLADVERSLLLFAEPQALGTVEGHQWFLRAGATALGHDHLAIPEQIASVDNDEMNARVLAVAKSPTRNRHLWEDAKEPFPFLAWCFERARYLREHEAAQLSPSTPLLAFETALPIELDGSSNALQHLALLTGSRQDAERVNLLPVAPTERPRDLYGEIAARVRELMEQMAALNEPKAKALLATGLVDRKLAKTPVMTISYGSSIRTRREHIRELIAETVIDTGEVVDPHAFDAPAPEVRAVDIIKQHGVTIAAAAAFAEHYVVQVFNETIPSAKPAMDYLRDCARLTVRAGHDIRWVAPTGLWVFFYARTQSTTTVRSRIHGASGWGGKIELNMQFEDDATAQPSIMDARNGIAPHFIQALDAAHLTRSVLRAKAEGMPLGATHDAVRVRPGDAAAIQRILMQELAALYTDVNHLVDFREQLITLYPDLADVLPEVDAYLPDGAYDLDPTEIVEAPYAFA